MTNLLSPAKSNFLLEVDLLHLHQETTEWLSELEFCKIELLFLQNLITKVGKKIMDTRKIIDLSALEKRIMTFQDHDLKKLHNEVIIHERNLSSLDENSLSQNEQSIRQDHKDFKAEISGFMSELRAFKKELFDKVSERLNKESR
jgi:hypothetical protein